MKLDQEEKTGTSTKTMLESSFDHAIDTLLDVSDDLINLTIDDACCTSDTSPTNPTLESPFVIEAAPPQDCDLNSHTDLIRDMEHASATSHSPPRILDFCEDDGALPKRVNIQDSKNTVRYFSRSKEEKAFVGRITASKKEKEKQLEIASYSPSVPESPVKRRYAEDDIVAAMADTVTDTGTKIREDVMTTMDQFIKWAGDEKIIQQIEGATKVVHTSLSESTAKVQRSIDALAELGKSGLGEQTAMMPTIASLNVKESWDETTSKLRATLQESSNQLKASIRAISNDTICPNRHDDSMESECIEAIEIPIYEHPYFGLERSSSEPVLSNSPASNFNVGVNVFPRLDVNVYHTTESNLHTSMDATHANQDSQTSNEVCLSDNGKTIIPNVPIRAAKLEQIGVDRKLLVIDGARRWNKSREPPIRTPAASPKLPVVAPVSAPPAFPEFLEWEAFPETDAFLQPILGESRFAEQATPTKSNRSLVDTPVMPSRTFKLKRNSPSMWKRSPVSTADI